MIWCLLLATPAISDEVREYGAVTVTIHDEPRLDLASKVRPAPQRKLSVPGDWLVLPHFEADVTGTSGLDTFFAVRNLTGTARNITLRYHTNTGSPVDQFVTLVAYQTRSFSIAAIAGLTPDDDGIARGFVDIIEQDAVSLVFPRKILQGDYFQVDPENDFASGDRLLNLTNLDTFYDLCQKLEIRFFNGGAFDGGTTLNFFVDTLQPSNEFVFSVYDEAGGPPVRTGGVSLGSRSVSLPASFLADTTQFGMIEIVFDGVLGHASGVFSALGRFSVGVDAACIEPTVFP